MEEDDSSIESNNSADEGADMTHSNIDYDDDDNCGNNKNEDLNWSTHDEDSIHDHTILCSQIAALVLNSNNYCSIRN